MNQPYQTVQSQGLITVDTPIGFELEGVKKGGYPTDGSSIVGRFNPNHWDPVYAHQTGLAAPIQTGEMSSAYISENVCQLFRRKFFQERTLCLQIRGLHIGQ
jgi:hypothetical protein